MSTAAAESTSGPSWLAAALPVLSPRMLLPRIRPVEEAFPFDAADTHYFYLARNAIFALAEAWNLRDREVLFPAYFHGVELEALQAAGVRPSFYPVHAGMRVDPAEVIERIGPETRAVYLIHYLGIPGPVQELADACRERGIPLIEDCALALLSHLGDRPLGSFGDASIFCLYKTLPVPNGGALVMPEGSRHRIHVDAPPLRAALSTMAASLMTYYEQRDASLIPWAIDRMMSVGRRAASTVDAERVDVGSQNLDMAHVRLGMNRFAHWVLAGQPYSRIVASRRRNFHQLAERLRPLGVALFDELGEGVCPLFFPIRVRDKDALLAALEARGVQAVNFWSVSSPIVPEGAFPEVDTMRRTIVELPCHQDLTPETVDRVADIVLGLRDLIL